MIHCIESTNPGTQINVDMIAIVITSNTINTDNRTVSNTTLSKELEFIERTYGIREEELPLMMKNALDVAFADDAVKERIFRQLV